MQYQFCMRTTLTIDDDVLDAAKAIAERKNTTIGEVISELARTSLRPQAPVAERNGVPLLPLKAGGAIVTPAIVKDLQDELP
jgi:hypothetical protein